jgi:hypothetical protein
MGITRWRIVLPPLNRTDGLNGEIFIGLNAVPCMTGSIATTTTFCLSLTMSWNSSAIHHVEGQEPTEGDPLYRFGDYSGRKVA